MTARWKAYLVVFLYGALSAGSFAYAASISRLPQTPSAVEPQPPSIVFGQLFRDVQLAQIFPDQKTFCDLIPMEPPAQIRSEYAAQKSLPGFSLARFVAERFSAFATGPVVSAAPVGEPAQAYISGLWNVLEESTGTVNPAASLLQLPRPFVVPGGRFREMYYWDSFFTMLGLEADGRNDIAENMVRDFAYEIDRFGHVPNGNRTYYLSRSQPPFFSEMVDLIARHDGPSAYARYLPELAREYAYWMDGSDRVSAGGAYHNVVRLRSGIVLNRYWDARGVPRDESYREDVATASMTKRPAADVYRNLRATAESGWDFSSRWLGDGVHLTTVRTLDLVPVDLNSLLEHLELTLSHAYSLSGNATDAKLFAARAATRETAIRSLLWDSQLGVFSDYDWTSQQLTHRVSAATLYPLFFRIATNAQAGAVARVVSTRLLRPNGVAATLVTSGQQWDEPNGWAPLQWISVAGLRTYGYASLAETIARRWLHANLTVFADTRFFVEKYDLETPSGGGGGEYTTQMGFGWTNGVFRALSTLYPGS